MAGVKFIRDAARNPRCGSQSNASMTTRGKLEHLIDLTGAVLDQLGRIREEVERLRAER
jgi:hypothetical protein